MDIFKKKDELEVRFPNKVVKLRGHQDDDVFTVFTESMETHPCLSDKEKKDIQSEIRKRDDIVVN